MANTKLHFRPDMANIKLYFVFVVVLLGNVEAESIPDHLGECYNVTSPLYREENLPMTMEIFIEIIRKVEMGNTMDMRNLALSLLHTFRVDGIEYIPNIVIQPGVIPFGVVGSERFKWRVLQQKYIPRPTALFPNNTITAIEKCTLHFMLSKSTETYLRGDESTVCNNLRTRRDVEEPNTEILKPEIPNEDGEIPVTDKIIDKGNTEENGTKVNKNPEETQAKSSSDFANVATDTTLITSSKNSTTENSSTESNDNDGKQVTDTESVGSDKPEIPETKVKFGKYVAKDKKVEISTCPIENGVVYNKYGSINLGTVIAGIATGLNQMDVPVIDNISSKNIWAATLAGDDGEVAVEQGSKSDVLTIGADGGWNSTVLPHYYFLKSNEKLQFTDAEVRGGLDGLIIAKNIKDWSNKLGKSLRLSQLLTLYYSEDGVTSKDTRACERKSNFSIIAPLQEAIQETYGFSKFLNKESETAEVADNVLNEYSKKAADALIKFVPSMQQTPCSTTSTRMTSVNATRNVEIDLYIIIDGNWEFLQIKTLIMTIATKLDLYLSKKTTVTIIANDRFQTIVNATMSVIDFFHLFNESTYIRSGKPMDLKSILENDLFNTFSNQLDILKQKNEAAGISTVVLFLPQGSINLDDTSLNACLKAMTNYKFVLPDLHLIYYVSSGGDRLNTLVENPSTDIISYIQSNIFDVDKLINSIRQGKRRIINPTCGATGTTQPYTPVKYNEVLPWKSVNYYKLSSKYLFGVKSGNIKIHENGYGTVRTCYSREVEEPLWSSNADGRVTCLISYNNDSTIPLSLPCKNYEFYYQCPPLYVSIEGLETLFKCLDSGCTLPTDVLVTISHEGLTCGVGCIISSKCLIIMAVIILLKNIYSVD